MKAKSFIYISETWYYTIIRPSKLREGLNQPEDFYIQEDSDSDNNKPGLKPPVSIPPTKETLFRTAMFRDQGMVLKHIPPRIKDDAKSRLENDGNILNLSKGRNILLF